jgi:hypothetical protein
MNGHRLISLSLLYAGNILEARPHCDRALALYDPMEHRPLAMNFGVDSGPAVLSYRSIALWLLGYPAVALTDAEPPFSGRRRKRGIADMAGPAACPAQSRLDPREIGWLLTCRCFSAGTCQSRLVQCPVLSLGAGNETARIHCATCRCRFYVAARRTRAAGSRQAAHHRSLGWRRDLMETLHRGSCRATSRGSMRPSKVPLGKGSRRKCRTSRRQIRSSRKRLRKASSKVIDGLAITAIPPTCGEYPPLGISEGYSALGSTHRPGARDGCERRNVGDSHSEKRPRSSHSWQRSGVK